MIYRPKDFNQEEGEAAADQTAANDGAGENQQDDDRFEDADYKATKA